jgi:prepilin-type processing-associated H-X9-DG protein
MRLRRKQHQSGAFTRIELMVVGLILVILMGVLLPQTIRKKHSAQLAACIANLKQVMLAEMIWQNDHETSRLSGEVSTNKGGTLEYLHRVELFQHFKSLSNELVTPAILACPSDNREAANGFNILNNSNLSYFVNMDVGSGMVPWQPLDELIVTVAIGDRNVTNKMGQRAGIMSITVSNYDYLGWNAQMHNKGNNASQSSIGNAAFADGSVETVTSSKLQRAFRYQGSDLSPSRLALP